MKIPQNRQHVVAVKFHDTNWTNMWATAFPPSPETHDLRISQQLFDHIYEYVASGRAVHNALRDFTKLAINVSWKRQLLPEHEVRRMFGGFNTIVDPTFPKKEPIYNAPIIQHDPLCTYEVADMDWAEPLGLASWQYEECHYEFVERSMKDRMFDWFLRSSLYPRVIDSRSLIRHSVS